MAAPDSLILIAGDPRRRQRLFLILLTKGQGKTLIGPAQASCPFSNQSLKVGKREPCALMGQA